MRIQKPIRGRRPDLTGIFGRGLILDLPFNEHNAGKVFDASGRRHDGTLKGNISWVGGGLNFPGADGDYVEIAHHPDFSFNGTPFTFSVWVYRDDISFFPIFRKGVIGTDCEFCLSIPIDGTIDFSLYDKDDQTKFIGRTTFHITDPVVLSVSQWYHVVITYDGGLLCSGFKIYVDGVGSDKNDNKSQFDFVATAGSHAVWIGRGDTTTQSVYANGRINNMMMWNRELMAGEARRLNELMYPLYED